MIIFNSLEEIQNMEPVAVALGNFDGLHRGHIALIETAVEQAKTKGIRSAVFTFANHPRNVMAGHTVVKSVNSEAEKIEQLEKAGIDYMFDLPFEDRIKNQSPEEFVKFLLLEKFNASTAICGFNFTYGFKAAGTAETLQAAGEAHGFDVIVIPSIVVDGEVVSSTLIRQCIADGDIEKASKLLGRRYTFRGEIVHGEQLGRLIGFPTCNIVVDDVMETPPNGVYITRSYINGNAYPSVTNVGNKPTVGSFAKNMETHIINFDQDVYGERIEVEFLKQVRPEMKFAGIDELKAQLAKDTQKAREYHAQIKG